jgi:hypothetical protein
VVTGIAAMDRGRELGRYATGDAARNATGDAAGRNVTGDILRGDATRNPTGSCAV